ncbi:uncharacterized protein N7483_009902 [Penicillium malachiteum]|uniref:uncharacterized protein n=1 Tax=Penicillium malachiteum TaxID=1324776 RepID=UPI0025492DE0|nr:uncharacterized protein N7483_009902 [Penicillium malachiteum]KAJ5718820.1 hypothetical protein N7483_009902 [Penicillium malachiteum]
MVRSHRASLADAQKYAAIMVGQVVHAAYVARLLDSATTIPRRRDSTRQRSRPLPKYPGKDSLALTSTPVSVSTAGDLPFETTNSPVGEYNRSTGLSTMEELLVPSMTSHHEDDALLHKSSPHLTRTGISAPARSYPVTPGLLAKGVEVLQFLLDVDLSPLGLRETLEEEVSPWGGPLARAAWRAAQNTMQELSAGSPVDQLTGMALVLFDETARPLHLPVSAANDALVKALSGERLRWETIGLCCAHIGSCIARGLVRLRTEQAMNSNSHPRSAHHSRLHMDTDARAPAMLRALYASTQCRTFCSEIEQVNDLVLWLLTMTSSFSTWCCGDDSSRSWWLMGDLASTITAMGLHRGFNDVESANIPSYLQELRKRAVSLAHELDKGLATFVGRPPRLHRQYFTLDLPLDMSDNLVMGPVEEFEAAKAELLDEKGWSRDEVSVHTASRHRSLWLLSIIREEVLELLLGPSVPESVSQAREILQRASTVWDSIPSRYYDASMRDSLPLRTLWHTIGPKMEYRYSQFLLHKLLIGQSEGNRDLMIQTSHEVLDLALSLLKKSDAFARERLDLEFMVTFYAMPCANVLIMELLRQSGQPQQSLTLNRSAAIQNISALISYCDSLVVLGQSNFRLCKQAQTTFSRCLDQILAAPTPSCQETMSWPGRPEMQDLISLASMDFGMKNLYPQDPEWSAWLETFN